MYDKTNASSLGELLLRAGFVNKTQLDSLNHVGKEVQARLGQMLVLAGYVSQRELQCAIDAQCLVREKITDRDTAANALRLVRVQGLNLQTALQRITAQHAIEPNCRLGDLLVEAGVIDELALQDAMIMCESTGLPLGRILALSGLVSEEIVRLAKELQTALRQGLMDRPDAICELRIEAGIKEPVVMPPAVVPQVEAGKPPASQEATSEADNVPQGAAPHGSKKAVVAVSAFLVLSKVVDRSEMEALQYVANGAEKDLIEAMVKGHAIPRDTANLAMLCYKQLEAGSVDLDQALFAFEYCKQKCDANVLLVDAAEQLGFQSGIWAIYDSLVAR